MNIKPNYYAVLEADVRYDKRLKPMEKLIYAEITALTNFNGNCEASNEYFANLYDVSKETVSRWVSNLKKYGYISVQIIYKNDAKTVEKRVVTLLTKKSTPPRQKSQDPIDKKVKENTTLTESNIINIKNTKKDFISFLELLKSNCPIKSKITKTNNGFGLFKNIENKQKLYIDYIAHQKKAGNYAKRITAFMEDYEYFKNETVGTFNKTKTERNNEFIDKHMAELGFDENKDTDFDFDGEIL